jgi:Fic family protein
MEIIKRKNYYYLKHSFRSKGKVITKEKYLGKKIPKDIEKIKNNFLKKTKTELYNKINKIKNNFRKEWIKYPKSIKKELLVDFSVNFTYNTNAIEGSTITEEETEELIKEKISPNKPIRDVNETINHSNIFLNMLNEKKDLNLSLLLKWHKDIFKQTKEDIAGKLREYSVKIANYRAPDWQDLKKLLKEFFEWYNKNRDKENPVELAGRMHYKFEKIHPFGDGNGRIGRLIINFILHKYHYPLFVVEYKRRRSYYRALKKDEEGFVKYFMRRYLSHYKKYLKD